MNPFRKQPATEAEPAPPVFDSDQEHQNRLARLRRELESFRALHAGSCLKFGQYEERSIVLGDIRAALQEIDRHFREDHVIIRPLTVQDILDEHIARKLVNC